MLTAEDLAYMRGTQDDARPTEAMLVARTETPDGMGGQTAGDSAPVPVTIRVATNERRVPDAILAANTGSTVVIVTMDLVPVQRGDHLEVSDDESYEVVSDGDTAEWTTAQQVYAVRRAWPS